MDMETENIKLVITNNLDMRRNLWTVLIVLTGGIATLFLNVDSIQKIILIIIGVICDSMVIYSLITINEEIDKCIKLLKDKAKEV